MLEALDPKGWTASLPFYSGRYGESIREWADVWWRSLARELLASGKSDPVPADGTILELGTFVNRQLRDMHHHLFHKTARSHLDCLLDGMEPSLGADERRMLKHTLEMSGAFDEEQADEYASAPGYALARPPDSPTTNNEPSALVPPPQAEAARPPSRSTTATPLNPRIASSKFDTNSFPPTENAVATPFNPRIASFQFKTNPFPPTGHAAASPVLQTDRHGQIQPSISTAPAHSSQTVGQDHSYLVQSGILRAAAMRYADPQLQRNPALTAPLTKSTQLPATPSTSTTTVDNVAPPKILFNPPDRPAAMYGHALHRFPLQDVPPNRAHGQSKPLPWQSVQHGWGEESSPTSIDGRPLSHVQIAEAKLERTKSEGQRGPKKELGLNVSRGKHALKWKGPKTLVDEDPQPKKTEERDDKQNELTGDKAELLDIRTQEPSTKESIQASPQPAQSGGKTTMTNDTITEPAAVGIDGTQRSPQPAQSQGKTAMTNDTKTQPAVSGTEDTTNKPHPLTDLDDRVRMRLNFQSKEMTRLRKDLNQEIEAKEKRSLEMKQLNTTIEALKAQNEHLKRAQDPANKPHPLTDIDPRITMRLNFQSKEMTRLRQELNAEMEAKEKRSLEVTELNTRMEAQQAENEQLKQQIGRLTTAEQTMAPRKADEQEEPVEPATPAREPADPASTFEPESSLSERTQATALVRRAEKAPQTPKDGRKYLLSGLILATQGLNKVPGSATAKARLKELLSQVKGFMPELSRNDLLISGLALLWYGSWLIPAEDARLSCQLQTLLIETEASLQRVISEGEDDFREQTEPKMSTTPASSEAYVVALEAELERLQALVEKLQNALIGIREAWRSRPSIKAMREEKNRARQRPKDDDHEAKPPLAGSCTTQPTAQTPACDKTEDDISKDQVLAKPNQPAEHDANEEIGPSL